MTLSEIKNDSWFRLLEALFKTGLVFDKTMAFEKEHIKMILKNPRVEFITKPEFQGKQFEINLGSRLSQRFFGIDYGIRLPRIVVGKDGFVYFHLFKSKYETSYYHRMPLEEAIRSARLILIKIKEHYDHNAAFVGEKINVDVHHVGIWDPDDHKIRAFICNLYDVEKKDLNEIFFTPAVE